MFQFTLTNLNNISMCLFLVPGKLKKNGYFPQTSSNFITGKKFNSLT